MHNWWIHGQQSTGPAGESLIRVSTCLYLKRLEDEVYYELIVVRDDTQYGPDFHEGVFNFEGYPTGPKGVLRCTEQRVSVQYEGDASATEWDTVMPAGEFSPVRLHELDKRQVPALLFQIANEQRLVYFSAWIHSFMTEAGSPIGVRRMFLVDLDDGAVAEVDEIKVTGFRGLYDVTTPHMGKFHIVRPSMVGDGYWGDTLLRRLDLGDYDIVHDPATGGLVNITPKS